MKKQMMILAGYLLPFFLICGCESESALLEEKFQLQKKNQYLVNQMEQLLLEKNQLADRITTLSGLDEKIRLQTISTIDRIEIRPRTGLYDKDNDGKKEILVVYLKTLDDESDAIKAAGTVDLQLWDLNRSPENALLEQWQISPVKLKKSWAGTFMTGFYRLPHNVGYKLTGKEKQLTVKVKFTDYLTGKILNDQKTFEP